MSFTGIDPARLFQILNNTGLQNKDAQLYQLLFNMINGLVSLKAATTSGGGGGGGGGGTVNNNFITQLLIGASDGQDGQDGFSVPSNNSNSASGSDYVVMSDGATPIPSPVDDGFGDFIYILYTP